MDPENVTLRREFVRCSKPACKRCKDTPGHGPYWYAYKRENSKLRKEYIGRNLPREYDDSLVNGRHAVAYEQHGVFYHVHCLGAIGYSGPNVEALLRDAGLIPVAPKSDILDVLRRCTCPQCGTRLMP